MCNPLFSLFVVVLSNLQSQPQKNSEKSKRLEYDDDGEKLFYSPTQFFLLLQNLFPAAKVGQLDDGIRLGTHQVQDGVHYFLI